MLCTIEGIGLKKPELAALLAFCKKKAKRGEEESHLSVVQFVVSKDRCFAYATDGHRAVEADGESDEKHPAGCWVIMRQFLDSALKLIEGDQVLRLQFAGASLNLARIEDTAGMEVSTFQWPNDAAPVQARFPDVAKLINLPQHASSARCVTVDAGYLADVEFIAKAAGRCGVDIFPPEDPGGLVHFVAQGDPTTKWTAVVMPIRSEEIDNDTDDDDGGKAGELSEELWDEAG